jgi:hypothetical protein
MTNINRTPSGVPTGGEFAEKTFPDAPSGLDSSVEVPFSGTVTLDRFPDDVLPEYPAVLPEPEVSLSFSDGKVETYIVVGDESFSFWGDDEIFNTTDNGDETGAFHSYENADEVKEQFIDWANEVHRRLDDNVYSVTLAATSAKGVSAALIAHALGKPVSA